MLPKGPIGYLVVSHLSKVLLCTISCIAALAVFFRFSIFSDDIRFFGDQYDGLIEVTLLEHWHNVWLGLESWSSPLFLFPYRNVLGYNDGLFATGWFYSVFRTITSNPFRASECSNAVIKGIGFVGNYVFIARALRIPPIWAVFGAIIFTISNNSFVQGNHAQLFTVAFAPVLGTLLNETVTAIAQRRRIAAAAWAVASSVCFSVWLITAFYMAWFFLGFAIVVLLITLFVGGVTGLRTAISRLKQCWSPMAARAATLVLAAAPFIWLYLPKSVESVVHSASETNEYLLRPADSLNLGGSSFLYAGLQSWLAPYFESNTEHATGFTPVLLLLFFASLISIIRKSNRDGIRISLGMGIAAIGLWLAGTKFGDHSLWPLIYRLVPGASAIRVVSRIQIFLAWPVVCIAMVGLASWCSWFPRRRLALSLASILALFICVEQINVWRVPSLDPVATMAWLRSIPPAPPVCQAFFVAEARPAVSAETLQSLVGTNIQAMLVAEWLTIPTVNGFASVSPSGWDLLGTDRPNYLSRVRDYVRIHKIETALCRLDLPGPTWDTTPFSSATIK